MPAWFLKYLPALIVAIAIGAALWFAHHAGVVSTTAKFELKESIDRERAAASIAEAERKARETENRAAGILAAQSSLHVEEQRNAQKEIDLLRAGMRAGFIRLSIPVTSCPPAIETGADPAIAGGPGAEARAELSATAADALIGIAKDGDDAIRQSNRLVDSYNELRAQLNAGTCGKVP
jgi:hypothetical protein